MRVPVWFLGTLCSLSLIALTWVQRASREPEVPDTSHPRVTAEGGNPPQWKFPSFPCIKAEQGKTVVESFRKPWRNMMSSRPLPLYQI